MSQRLAYSGNVRLTGSDPERLEVWVEGVAAAVAFQGGTQRGVLTSLTLGLTEDRRLTVTGLDADGEQVTWEATDAERVSTRWGGARISWPSGKISTGATVTGSQHGVTIHADGETTLLPAGRLQSVGSQRWIVESDGTRFLASGRGCGCGGRR